MKEFIKSLQTLYEAHPPELVYALELYAAGETSASFQDKVKAAATQWPKGKQVHGVGSQMVVTVINHLRTLERMGGKPIKNHYGRY